MCNLGIDGGITLWLRRCKTRHFDIMSGIEQALTSMLDELAHESRTYDT